MARHPTLDVGGACFDSASSNICVTRLVSREGFEGSQHKVECHRHTYGISSCVKHEWHAVDGKQ